jgi:5-methyltetrahydropteroyltriglutamate--homocysteine methyltransferase
VDEVVKRQVQAGLDVIDDGEFSKPGFIHYITERLSGFDGPFSGDPGYFDGSREHRDFPEVYRQEQTQQAAQTQQPNQPPAGNPMRKSATGPIKYIGQEHVQRDIENLKAAAQGLDVEELFLPAISPSSVEHWQSNDYYKTQEEYLFAIADALHDEYKAITDAGIVVQIDDPHIAMWYMMKPEMSIEDVRKWAAVRIEAVNQSLKGVPRELVRWHTCYGIDVGPRVHDLELKHFVDLVLRIDAGGFSFEGANPRHDHEYEVWETTKLPDGVALIPGVITHSTVLVEHPELVKQRILRYANLVGRENVIAAADCGFGSFAGSSDSIPPSVVWAKFDALVEGSRLASKELWK